MRLYGPAALDQGFGVYEFAPVEAVGSKATYIDRGGLSGENQLREYLTDGRGDHESVSAESVCEKQPWGGRMFSKYRVVIGSHCIEAGPPVDQFHGGESRDPPHQRRPEIGLQS